MGEWGQMQRALCSRSRTVHTSVLVCRLVGIVRRARSRSGDRIAEAPVRPAHMMMSIGVGIGEYIQLSEWREVKSAVGRSAWMRVRVLVYVPGVRSNRGQCVPLILLPTSLHVIRRPRIAIRSLPRTNTRLMIAGSGARALCASHSLSLWFKVEVKHPFLGRLLVNLRRSPSCFAKRVQCLCGIPVRHGCGGRRRGSRQRLLWDKSVRLRRNRRITRRRDTFAPLDDRLLEGIWTMGSVQFII
jgi:hypothetical protein